MTITYKTYAEALAQAAILRALNPAYRVEIVAPLFDGDTCRVNVGV